MTLDELDKKLQQSIDIFNIEGIYHTAKKTGEELNEYDYDEICKQTCYVFYDFKENIIKYLKELEKQL